MNLLIRADASARIGTGHVMRCLALAQAWSDAGGRAVLLSAPLPPALETRLGAGGLAVAALQAAPGSPEDAAETARQAQERNAEWVVVDGYQFDASYQKAIKDAGAKLLIFDDNGDAEFYHADLVLNQNIHAQADWYISRAPETRLLLGTRYALLRREFSAWRDWRRETTRSACRVLVTLGGSDPDNVTLKALEALSLIKLPRPNFGEPERKGPVPVPRSSPVPPELGARGPSSGTLLEATVVIGGGNPHRASLEAEAARAAFPVRVVVNAPNMPELMAWADLAVSAGGSTVWELAFMGLPALILATAENQRGIAQGMDAAGAAQSLGWASEQTAAGLAEVIASLQDDPARRVGMSRWSREIVDGLGADRVLETLHR